MTAVRRTPRLEVIAVNAFPKSGNTWIRQFLSELLFDGDLSAIPDQYRQEILDAEPYTLPDGRTVRLFKSHDAKPPTRIKDMPVTHVAGIHVVRHPLDVFTSHLNFLHLRDEAGENRAPGSPFITDFDGLDDIRDQDMIWAFLGVYLVYGNLNPRFVAAGSWFENVEGWRTTDFPLFSLRYESLLAAGADDLLDVGRFFGKSEEEVRRAFDRTRDKTARDGRFFWRQQAGTHRDYLTVEQIAAFERIHGDRMKDAGY